MAAVSDSVFSVSDTYIGAEELRHFSCER